MLHMLLGLVCGIVLLATIQFALKQLKKWQTKRKYQQYKVWQQELTASSPWSWDKELAVDHEIDRKFRPIKHP